MKTTFIYSLEDESGNIRYIGKSNDPTKRLSGHLTETKFNYHKRNWIKSLLDKGFKPIVKIIQEVPSDNWQYWEKLYIAKYKEQGFNLLNATDGGDGPEDYTQSGENNGFYGKKHSEESKEKMKELKLGIKFINRKSVDEKCKKEMSERNKGKKLSEETIDKIRKANKGRIKSDEERKNISKGKIGKPRSEETKKKISEKLKGRKLSKETCEKISKAFKGRIFTENHKINISKGQIGKKLSDEQKKKISNSCKGHEGHNKIKVEVYNYKTGEYVGMYDSFTECGKILNINSSKISEVIKGNRNHTGGYTFKLVN